MATAPPERTLANDVSVPLGILYGTVLDAAHAPVGPAKILGDTAIYEMDADIDGDRVVILATTTAGVVLVNGLLVNNALPAAARTSIPWERPLASPAVLAVGERVHLAMLESPGTADARVLTATLARP